MRKKFNIDYCIVSVLYATYHCQNNIDHYDNVVFDIENNQIIHRLFSLLHSPNYIIIYVKALKQYTAKAKRVHHMAACYRIF